MTNLKPDFLFNTIDPVFLKLGKPIARHIAKKDRTENILFKRENQSKLIVLNAIKLIKHSLTFMKFFMFTISSIMVFLMIFLMITAFILSKEVIHYAPQIGAMAYATMFIFLIAANASGKQFEREGTIIFLHKHDKTYVLKDKAYRIHEFYRRMIRFKFIPSAISHISVITLITITLLSSKMILPMCKVTMYLYPIVTVVVFANWCFNYLVAAAIHHCDDHGKKEKKTSKEKKEVMVPDAV